MKIAIATDHAGFELKETIKKFLTENGYEVDDFGAFEVDQNDDYPDFISKASMQVAQNPKSMGIIFGGSGQGEAITANKITNIRAAVYNAENLELVKLAREHNNANILSIGARFISPENAKEAVRLFLETPFSNEERHTRRINKIKDIENGQK